MSMDNTLNSKRTWIMLLFLATGCTVMATPASTALPTSVTIPTVLPTETSTAVPTATAPVNTPTPTAQAGVDAATFVRETYPDYSVLAPGEKFVKTWEVKNIGTNTWNTDYSLVVDSTPQNEALGSPAEISFPDNTPPGATAVLSVNLTAPTVPGTYSVYWRLQNDRGQTFGVDGDRVWVTVMVCAAGETCSPPTRNGSASANGVSATLTNFAHEAGSATVDFCMTVPNRNYALDQAPRLLVDQEPAPLLDGGTILPWGCYEFRYQVSAAEFEAAQGIRLSIDGSLRMSPPPGDPNAACESARSDLIVQYPGLDFQCNFSMTGYYTDLRLPSSMNREQANQVIVDAIEDAIYGPWTLKIK
jgi:hypothetical protein